MPLSLIQTLLALFLFIFFSPALSAEYIIPMDEAQNDHLKAYGVIFRAIEKGVPSKIALNYRGGSFLVNENKEVFEDARIRNVTIEVFGEKSRLQRLIQTSNVDLLPLEKVPKVAIYKPPATEPWDDAVTMAVEYAEIPYTRLWDREVLRGKLSEYDWLHLHHEDFTGQNGKFYAFAKNMQWYQKRRLMFEKMARELGFRSIADQKKAVALAIQSFVAKGGFLFAMCSATDTIDIALAAQHIDIVDPLLDSTPITPGFNQKLDYNSTFAFENFRVYTDPYVYEFSDIDINPQKEGIVQEKDHFSLFEFNAHIDPIPSLLTQNHTREISGFLGQTTAFARSKLKPRVLILGETLGTDRVKYIYGSYKKGFFSFYGGHDPEDYQHLVGDPPTNLALHKNSPGYRLILNNILLPAAKKKKRKT